MDNRDMLKTNTEISFTPPSQLRIQAKSFQCSEAESHEWSEPLVAMVQGPLKGPESFWFFNHPRDFSTLEFFLLS